MSDEHDLQIPVAYRTAPALMNAPDTQGLDCRRVTWQDEEAHLRTVREEVFVREQRIDPALDFDGLDAASHHVLVRDGEAAVATARLQPDGQVGRVCVLPDYRGRGLGAMVTREAVALARDLGMAHVHLHAQVDAMRMYEKLGFVADGEVFEEAGIEHINMSLP